MESPEKSGAPTSSPIFAASHHPVTLKFEDVVYRIRTCRSSSITMKTSRGISDGSSGAKGDDHRFILKGVSGTVLPGEMLALMGPSGSGKTTLLTALGGRLQAEGTITYNGRAFSDGSMKRSMGFVTQDDVLYPHLTVEETLVYTALLRLPRQLTRRQKAAQAEGVMWQLGLAGCGGSVVRGVSGGERKRVSIGQEMLVNPSLLLLDEPTSGLDSTTAQRIVSTLWELSRGGMTVLMTIHQPSSRLFYMFDRLLLLSDGSPVYFGRASEAMDYFASVGFAPPVLMNPADFLLDLANGVYLDESSANDERTGVREEIVLAYREHLEGKVQEEIGEMFKQFNDGDQAYHKRSAAAISSSKWVTTWWEQFTVLLSRGLKERRHESFSALKIAQVLIVAILSGCLWWQSGGHAQDQVGLLFFISGFWGFFPVFQAIFTFPQELSMLNKERSSGMYRLSSYFTARMVGDLPMELLLPTIFTVIVYWMAGMKPTPAHFFATLSVVLLSVLAAQGLGLAIGALIMDLKSATTLASVVMLTFMLAGGYYVQQVPAFIAWLKYISLSFYTFKLLASSQYSPNETYRCQGQTCKVADLPSIKLVGLDNYIVDIIVLLAMLVSYRLVAYLALTRVGLAVAQR